MLEGSECFDWVFSVGSVGPHSGVPQRILDPRAKEGYLRVGPCPLLPPHKKNQPCVTLVLPVPDASPFAWSSTFRRFCLQGLYPGFPTISFREIRYHVGVGLRPDNHHIW